MGDGSFVVSNKDTLAFMNKNKLEIIVRSHPLRINDIFELEEGKKVVNIGSSSYYSSKGTYILPDDKIRRI